MATLHVPDLLIYRWRYKLGYLSIGIACVALLLIASLYIPGGLSEREIKGVATTSALSLKQFAPDMIVNVPYYLMQKVSFFTFGLSEFSIKLPTIILGFLSVIGLVLLLRMWFKQNVAILTVLICITTGPFLLAAQSGTPGILFIFWPIWIFYFASRISRRAAYPLLTKALFFTSVALSLYTPLSIYVLIALGSAALLHPHLRHLLRQLSKLRIAITLFVAAMVITPLAYSMVLKPELLLTLLGVSSSLDIAANLQTLFNEYANILHPSNGTIMTPVYEVASLLLIGLGLYRIITAKYTARSYILSAWLLLLLPILIVSPQLVNVTFVPFLLLTGYGVDFLIRYWYKLFPNNPYARVVGLIPIMIFITTLIFSGIDRFVYGYLYNPSSSMASSNDLSLLRSQLSDQKKNLVTLAITDNEKAFYDAARRFNPSWGIQTITTNSVVTQSDTTIVTHAASQYTKLDKPIKIVTNAMNRDADRFYIYKNSVK